MFTLPTTQIRAVIAPTLWSRIWLHNELARRTSRVAVSSQFLDARYPDLMSVHAPPRPDLRQEVHDAARRARVAARAL
ncbi:hypothetical protein, partial [Mycobacterium celatum]|uniref:hypothetical protein n=1 Tax=Mycobacterium celatum TaxID=28045 RepID=UPI0012ED8635